MSQTVVPPIQSHWNLAFNELSEAGHFVEKLLRSAAGPVGHTELRQDPRFHFPYLVQVWPIDGESCIDVSAPISVLGKHLSLGGFSFYHHRPIPHRVVAVQFPGTSRLIHRLRLKWCRFLGEAWYDSGGKFEGVHVQETNATPID